MAEIQEKLSRVRAAANDIADSASGKIKDSAEKMRESAGDLIQTGRDKAGEALTDARDRTSRVATRANEIVTEHPVAAVAGAVAAGALIAWMFPKSRKAMRALPAVATSLGARAVNAAIAARTLAGESAEAVARKTGAAVDAARDGATGARDSIGRTDMAALASRLADQAAALVAEKAEAIAKEVKSRLPRK